MTRTKYFLYSLIYCIVMTCSWSTMTENASENAITVAATISSVAFLVGIFHLGSAGDELRGNNTAPRGIADTIINPLNIPPRTFAAFFGMGATLITIPSLLSISFQHQDTTALLLAVASLLLYYPLVHPPAIQASHT